MHTTLEEATISRNERFVLVMHWSVQVCFFLSYSHGTSKLFYSQPSAFFLRSMPSASSNHDPSSFRPLWETQVEPRTSAREGMERGIPRVERHANPALYARSRSLKQCATCGRGTRNVFLGSITYRRCSKDLTFNERRLVHEEREGALVLVRSW